jgi:hypothetical protein
MLQMWRCTSPVHELKESKAKKININNNLPVPDNINSSFLLNDFYFVVLIKKVINDDSPKNMICHWYWLNWQHQQKIEWNFFSAAKQKSKVIRKYISVLLSPTSRCEFFTSKFSLKTCLTLPLGLTIVFALYYQCNENRRFGLKQK